MKFIPCERCWDRLGITVRANWQYKNLAVCDDCLDEMTHEAIAREDNEAGAA